MPDQEITVVETTETIVVTEKPTQVVEVANPQIQIVEVVARGPQGPQGPTGDTTVGGYPVVMSNANNGDVLSFSTSIMSWYNRNQETLTDGGNF